MIVTTNLAEPFGELLEDAGIEYAMTYLYDTVDVELDNLNLDEAEELLRDLINE